MSEELKKEVEELRSSFALASDKFKAAEEKLDVALKQLAQLQKVTSQLLGHIHLPNGKVGIEI
jgi:uncharacterized coiled-coil DUF342 family protein